MTRDLWRGDRPRSSAGDTNDEREEGRTLDQGGGDEHRRLDLSGDFGLPSHALDGRGADLSDAVAGTQKRHARADRSREMETVVFASGHRRDGERQNDCDRQRTNLNGLLHVTTPQCFLFQTSPTRLRRACDRTGNTNRPSGQISAAEISAGSPPSK